MIIGLIFRSSKSVGDIESEVTSPSQKSHDAELENEQEKHTSEYLNKIKQEDASVGLVTVKGEELHKNADLTSSDGSEQDSPRAESVKVLKVRRLVSVIFMSHSR